MSVLLTVLVFVPILTLMLTIHEFGHYLTARLSGITVQEFGIGLPPRAWGFTRGGIVYSLNWIPFGAFVKMLGEEDPTATGSFASKPRLIRTIVLAAGPLMNLLLAALAFSAAYMIGMAQPSATGPVHLADIAPSSPAAQAGLLPGDVIVRFAGQSITDQTQFRQLVMSHLGQSVDVVAQRGDQQVQSLITPRANPPEGQGSLGVVMSANIEIVRSNPIAALASGSRDAWSAFKATFELPRLIMEGRITADQARPTGLVGMAEITGQAVDYGRATGFWTPIFQLTGFFSASLAFANFLPIPALDGGRLLFILIEWVRGRRVAPQREATYHLVGMIVLLTFMVLVSINDIRTPMPRIDFGFR